MQAPQPEGGDSGTSTPASFVTARSTVEVEFPETVSEASDSTTSTVFYPVEEEEQFREQNFQRDRRDQATCPLKCAHPRSPLKPSDDWAYFHSVTLPCSIKNVWAYILEASTTGKVEDTYRKLRSQHSLPPKPCYATILARVTEDLLDPHFVMPVSELALRKVLTTRVSGLPHESGMSQRSLEVPLHASLCREIGVLMEGEKGTPGMAKYRQLTIILAKPERWHSWFIQDAITARCGPVTDLAASVTIENINYWMNLFKVSASTDFLHRIFGCPSVAGKCAALIELLEIHGFLWQSINTELIQGLVSMLYSLLKFMMETCKMATKYAVQGYEWVAAKFRRSEGEVNNFPDIEPNLPETEAEFLANPDRPEHQVGFGLSLSDTMLSSRVREGIQGYLKSWYSTEDTRMETSDQAACDEACGVPPLVTSFPPGERTPVVDDTKPSSRIRSGPPSTAATFKTSPSLADIHSRLDKSVLLKEFSPSEYETCSATSSVRFKASTISSAPTEKTTENFAICRSIYDASRVQEVFGQAAAYQDFVEMIRSELKRDPKSPEILRIQDEISAQLASGRLSEDEREDCLDILQLIIDSRMPHIRDWVESVESESKTGVSFPPPAGSPQSTPSPLSAISGPMVAALIRSASPRSNSSTSSRISESQASAHLARVVEPGAVPPKVQAVLESQIPVSEVRSICELIKNMEFSELGRRLLEWIKKVFSDVYKFFLDNPLMGAVIGIVWSVLSFLGFTVSEFTTQGDKKTFFQKMSSSMRDIYYCQRGKDAIFSSFSTFVDVASDMLDLNKDPDVEKFKETLEKLQEEMNKTVLEASTSPGTFVNDSKKFKEFQDVMEAVTKQYKMLIALNPRVNMAYLGPVWNQILSAYNKLQNIWAKYLASGGLRQEPVCIWLYGPTMLGKSSYAQWLVDTLNEINKTEWQVFTISKGPEYWNGYSQQEIVLIDDFASYIGPEGCLDALAVMNLCSCAAYNPNMAALEDKVIQARPKIVIVCSNHATIPLNAGITDMVAFERRRDVFIEVTWPEHTNCGPTTDCEHFKNVNQNNFDHLTFTIKNPIVSIATTEPQKSRQVNKRQRTDGVVYKQRKPVTLGKAKPMEIVELVAEKIIEKRQNYEVQLARRERRTEPNHQADTADVSYWESNPNVVVMGPGGTGKSYIFRALASQWEKSDDQDVPKRRVRMIATLEEFEAFADAKFSDPNVDVVIFDDTSTYCDSPKLSLFLQVFKARYDVGDDSCPLWLVGVNEEVLRKAMERFNDPTYFDIIMRRADVYKTQFKTKGGVRGLFGARYTHRDVASIRQDGKKINDMVEYSKEGTDLKFSCDSLRSTIKRHKHCKSLDTIITRLPIRSDLEPDVFVSLKMTGDEFVDQFVNEAGTLSKAIALLAGDHTEFRTSDPTISKMQIGDMILKTYRQCREVAGCHFSCMYDFVLEAYVNGMFDAFRGHTYVLQFTDCSYYITTTHRGVEAGILEVQDLIAYRIALEANTIREEISGMDMAAALMSNLPPWFCLATQCVASFVKMGATFFACSQVVSQNDILFRALERSNEMKRKTSEYIEKTDKAVVDNYQEALDQQLQKMTQQAPLYPKQPGREGTVCHATIADQDPFLHKELFAPKQQEHSPETRFKTSRLGRLAIRNNRQQSTMEKLASAIEPAWKKQATNRDSAEMQIDLQGLSPRSYDRELEGILEQPEAQAMIDGSLPAIIGAVVKNCVSILERKSGRKLCHGVMIKGHVGTTVQHIAAVTQSIDVVDCNGARWPVTIIKQEPGRDRLDFRIEDPKCPAFRNIIPHITTKDHSPIENKSAVLVTFSDWLKAPTILIRSYTVQAHTYYMASQAEQHVPGYTYVGTKAGFQLPNVNTFPGDCGSLLMVVDANWSRKIIGIHAAASSQVAYAREMYAEDYYDLTTKPTQQAISEPFVIPTSGFFGHFDEFIVPKAKKDRDGRDLLAITTARQFTPATSKLWLSPMPFGPRLYEPSLLSPHDTRNPWPAYDFMSQETFQWMQERKEIPDDLQKELDFCFDVVGDYFAQTIRARGCKLKVLSKMGAVNKMREIVHSKPVQLNSSAGYPWNAMVQKGKKNFIDMDPMTGTRYIAKNELGQALHNAVDGLIDDARQGRESFAAFKICLKDELVKTKKIYEEPKTRTIAAAPLHVVIALRQYFHAAHAAIAECWDELPPKIGIAANTLDWHTLFSKLAAKSNLAFDFDYKGWDFLVHPDFIRRLYRIYNKIYKACDPNWSEIDDTIRENLILNLIYKFVFLFMSRVYKATGGMPSGQPGTAIDNSIINFVMMFFMWRLLAPEGFRSFSDFLQDCGIADYGDDILMTVSKFAAKFFNGVTVAAKLKEVLGVVVTSAQKDQPIVETRPLEECEFMSRGFKRMYGFWVGPLRKPQILKSTHFVAGPRSHYYWEEQNEIYFEAELYKDVANSCLREMFLHGEEDYDELRNHFICSFSDLQVPAYFPSYQEAMEEFFSIKPQCSAVVGEPTHIATLGIKPPNHYGIPDLTHPAWNHFYNRSCIQLGAPYHFTGASGKSASMGYYMRIFMESINYALHRDFNSCLVNIYEPGGVIPWHQDDEKELDKAHGVFCYTVTGDGCLQYRQVENPLSVESFPLQAKFFYLIEGIRLRSYQHRRINHRELTVSLTFRRMRVPGDSL